MAASIVISPAGTIPTSEILQTTRSARSVNAVITASSDMGAVLSVTATLDASEPGVRIISGTTSVSIIGTYKDPFQDSFTYVEKGSSDLLETPTVVVGASKLPPNKDYYNLDQDQRKLSTRTYTVSVSTGSGTTEFEVTHDILNDLDGMTSFVGSYYS